MGVDDAELEALMKDANGPLKKKQEIDTEIDKIGKTIKVMYYLLPFNI